MKCTASVFSWGLPFSSLLLLGTLLTGCPDTNPNPDPDPVPLVRFLVPQKLATDQNPEAVASALINSDAFPDIVTANRGDNTLTCWLADGANGFKTGQRLLTGATEPRAVALGDLDLDGATDIVSANTGSNNLSIFYGAGNGTFETPVLVALPAGAQPRDIAMLDVNEDGHMDLISANSALASISIMLADGAGAFAPPVQITTGDGPRALLLQDLNNDTFLDLVTSDRDADALSVFINDPESNFRPRVAIPTGTNPRMALAKDLDNDGWSDLVVSNPGSSNIGVHMGAGNGAFDPVIFIPTDGNPTRIAVGDYTGDGKDDVLAILFDSADDLISSGRIQCLAGDGRGDFNPFDLYFAGAGVVAIVANDLDRDGTLDLAACNVDKDQLLVIPGDHTTGLAMERRFAAGLRPRMVAPADFNRDGDLDLAVANLDSSNVTILLGDGKGAFTDGVNIPAGGSARALVSADFNKDNRADLAVTNLNQSRVAVLLGDGDGTFAAATFYSVRQGDSGSSAEPRSLAVADLNKDGSLDLIAGNAARDSVAILLGDGKGVFAAAKEYDAGNFPLDVQVADVDKNGKLDVVLVNGVDVDGQGSQTSALRVIPGKGDGTLDVANDVGYVAGVAPGSLVVADLDNDGDLDAATCHNTLDNFQLYANRGDGSFGSGGLQNAGDAPNGIGAIDLNQDGRLDLFSTNDAGRMTIRINRSGLRYETAVSVTVGDTPIDGIFADLNGDDYLDIITPNRGTNDVSVVLGAAL